MATSMDDHFKPKKPLATYGKSKRQGFAATMKSTDFSEWDGLTGNNPTAAAAATVSKSTTKDTLLTFDKEDSTNRATTAKAPTKTTKKATAAPKTTLTKNSLAKGATDPFALPDFSDKDAEKPSKPIRRNATNKATAAATTTTTTAEAQDGTKRANTTSRSSKRATKASTKEDGDKAVKAPAARKGAKRSLVSAESPKSPIESPPADVWELDVSTVVSEPKPLPKKPMGRKVTAEASSSSTSNEKVLPSAAKKTTQRQTKTKNTNSSKRTNPESHTFEEVSAVSRPAEATSSGSPVDSETLVPEKEMISEIPQPSTKTSDKPSGKKRTTASVADVPKPASKSRRVGTKEEVTVEKQQLKPVAKKATKRRSPTVEEQEVKSRPKLPVKSQTKTPPSRLSTSSQNNEVAPTNTLEPRSQISPVGSPSNQDDEFLPIDSPEVFEPPIKKNLPKLGGGMRESLANLLDELEEPSEQEHLPKKRRMMGNSRNKRHSSEEKSPTRSRESSQASSQSSSPAITDVFAKGGSQSSPSRIGSQSQRESQRDSQMTLQEATDQIISTRSTGIATYGRQRSYLADEMVEGQDPFLQSLLPPPRPAVTYEEEEEELKPKNALKSKFELRAAGSTKRFLDEMEGYIQDIEASDARRRRSGFMELAGKAHDSTFVKRFSVNSFDQRLFVKMDTHDDEVIKFCVAYMLIPFMKMDTTGSTLKQITNNGALPMLDAMLHSPRDIVEITKDKSLKLSKITQSLVVELRAKVLASPMFADYEVQTISPRLVALKVLDEFVHSMRGAGIFHDVLPDSDLSLLVQSFKPFIESSGPPAISDMVFIELPASILMGYLVYNRKPVTEQFTTEEIEILINLFRAVMVWESPDPNHTRRIKDVQNIVLRLTVNFMTGNYDASTLFVDSDNGVEVVVKTILRKNDSLAELDDQQAEEEVDLIVLLMSMLQNFAKVTFNIIKTVEKTLVDGKSVLDVLIDLFIDRNAKASEATTQREVLENIPLGTLSVTLAYWCRDRNLRAIIREKTGAGSLKTLSAALEQFYSMNKAITDQDSDFEDGAGGGILEELQRLVDDMSALS